MKLEFVTEIQVEKHNHNYPASIKVDERGFYISSAACRQFDISPGQYFHLVKGKNERGVIIGWYIVTDDDPKDGYRVCASNHGAALIVNKPLCRLFRISTGSKCGDSFYMQDTNSTHNESKVIEILTHKTVKELKLR